MSVKPRYWDTKKGQVLKAIVISEGRTWNEIQRITGYTEKEINQALTELFTQDDISKSGSSYWIEDYDLFCKYRDYIQGNNDSQNATKEEQEAKKIDAIKTKLKEVIEYIRKNHFENMIIGKIIWWSLGSKIEYKHDSEHFFVEGDLLDRLCKDVIDSSTNKVVVVNPFVDRCSLSDKLKDASVKGRPVFLITRSPLSENSVRVRASRKEYHKALHQNGVNILYNNRIHSKIIVADDVLGIVSSMNFKSESSSGQNLEAGLVTWQKETIGSLNAYITKLMNEYESTQYTV